MLEIQHDLLASFLRAHQTTEAKNNCIHIAAIADAQILPLAVFQLNSRLKKSRLEVTL